MPLMNLDAYSELKRAYRHLVALKHPTECGRLYSET